MSPVLRFGTAHLFSSQFTRLEQRSIVLQYAPCWALSSTPLGSDTAGKALLAALPPALAALVGPSPGDAPSLEEAERGQCSHLKIGIIRCTAKTDNSLIQFPLNN